MEFEAAIGYEPNKLKTEEPPVEEPQDHVMEEVVETFKGSGVRLDGKKKKDNQLDTPVIKRVGLESFVIKPICFKIFVAAGTRSWCTRLRLQVWILKI